MKRKNQIFTSQVVNSSLLMTSLLAMSPDTLAQFNKYRSRNKVDPTATTVAPAEVIAPETTGEPPAQEAVNNNDVVSDAESDSDNESSSSSSGPDFSDSAEDESFGTRSQAFGFTGSKTNSKYVNLNPETGFGPEIVESFDFPNTDIMELTKHMQKLSGINLILDKDIKGKVSISAPTPITVGDAWKAYLTALEMSGYTLVKSGAFWKVINARDIRYTPTKIYTGNFTPDNDNYIMKVISLKNISASEVSRNFRPFMSRYGRIIDIKQTNTLIVADTGTNIVRLEKLVKFLDVPGHEESLQIMPVRNSSAQEIAKLLDTILKDKNAQRRRGGAAPDGESAENISRIIAEPRTNSIIAMANATGAKQLKDLIEKLDVKLVASGSSRVHVHYLNHGDAEELSKTLSNLVSGAKTAASAAGGAGAAGRFTGAEGTETIFNAEVKVTADKPNNALVVTASPTDWLTLKDVIAKLDIPRDQVYVEGLIMETAVDRDRAFGTSVFGAYGASGAQRGGYGGTTDLLNLIGGQFQNLSGMFVGIGAGGTRDIKIGADTFKVSSVNGIIKAVAGHSLTNVLATPQILASDNTEATFEVGETVPTLTTTTSTGGNVAGNITSQKVALVLKLKPQINKVTRFIKLNIDQRIDDFNNNKQVGGQVAAAGGVATTTRSAQTEVIVRDRDTIAMGGLMRDKETTSFSKVPLLGDIPVLGWLFKNQSRNITKVNMLFFLTPKILAPYEKTAGQNTKEVIKRRGDHLTKILDKDTKDPFEKDVEEITTRAEAQAKGPLYDPSASSRYNDSNMQLDRNITPVAVPAPEVNDTNLNQIDDGEDENVIELPKAENNPTSPETSPNTTAPEAPVEEAKKSEV
jgi:general secretion pathway protein D